MNLEDRRSSTNVTDARAETKAASDRRKELRSEREKTHRWMNDHIRGASQRWDGLVERHAERENNEYDGDQMYLYDAGDIESLKKARARKNISSRPSVESERQDNIKVNNDMEDKRVEIGFDGLTNMKADEVKSEAPKTRKWHGLFEERKEE